MELPRFAELLSRHLEGIARLSDSQVSQLYSHFALLVKWNQRINLTSVWPPDEIVIRHYCESIFFAEHVPVEPGAATILDVGSGAGFPGVPMAVLHPEWRVALVESHQRKSVFLRESSRGLHNISVLAQRAELIQGKFDWLVSRAVRPSDVLALVPQLSSRIGLLIGEADLLELGGDSGIDWSPPVRLPWGERRVCAFGSVSRGTHAA